MSILTICIDVKIKWSVVAALDFIVHVQAVPKPDPEDEMTPSLLSKVPPHSPVRKTTHGYVALDSPLYDSLWKNLYGLRRDFRHRVHNSPATLARNAGETSRKTTAATNAMLRPTAARQQPRADFAIAGRYRSRRPLVIGHAIYSAVAVPPTS